MKRQRRTWIGLAVAGLIGGVFVLGSSGRAEDDPEWIDQLAVIAAYTRAATPGEQHELLAGMAGEWTFEVTTLLGPKALTTTGTARFESILGGRYVVERTKSTLLGQSFDGFALHGYDNVADEYFVVWVDSWSTGTYEMRGKSPTEGEPIVLAGSARDALSPQGRPWRMVRTWTGDDAFRLEIFDTLGGDGKSVETKVTDLRYRRKE